MGAVNYFTSKYITMGLKPYDASDFENDEDFMNELQEEVNKYGGTLEEALNNYIFNAYEDDYTNVEAILEKHMFYYYHIIIKPGYYEGFTLDIENNFPVAFDGWENRREVNKEITEIKQFLINCAGLGLVACSPGWCMKYEDYEGTIKAINVAIKEMREEAKATPTWRQYEKSMTRRNRK